MAKAKKKAKKKAAPKKKVRVKNAGGQKINKAKQRRIFVYHITKFQERFELKDDVRFCREKPLEYLRFYVGSGRTDDAIAFKQQIVILKTSQNRPYLRSAFDDLMESAANWSRCYRGYILISAVPVVPATEGYIAHLIGFDIKRTRATLRELLQIGLVERVPLPEFDLSLNETPQKKTRPDGPGCGGSRVSRSGSRNCEKIGESFKKTENGNGKRKRKNNKNNNNPEPEKKASAKPTQPAGAKARQSMTEEQRQERKNRTVQQLRGGDKVKGNHPSPDRHPSETETETDKPTETDAGVGKQRTGCSSNPPPSIIDREIDQFLNNALGGNQAYYSEEAKQFGAEIFRKLGVPYDPTSPEGLSELCSFASLWDKAVEANLSPSVLSELWDSSIRDAEKIAKRRGKTKFKKSLEATWCYSFNRRLEARMRRRAS